MKNIRSIAVLLFLQVLFVSALAAQTVDWKTFDPKKASPEEMDRINRMLEGKINTQLGKKTGSPAEIKSLIMKGNKITTVVYNYGNITRPSTLANVADLVWNHLGYGFEFTPLVAGKVKQGGVTYRILDDGMWLPSQGGYAPDGSLKWGWLPKTGYSAPGQPDIAAWSHRSDVLGDLSRKPHSWPEAWYNSTLGRYVWPSFLGNDATTPDEEVYFVVDDYSNKKYEYYPFSTDSTKRGLGLDMEVRFFQFNNPLAEDIIFLVYRVTNRSPVAIDSVWFGMYGDPHVGGSADFADDRAFFIPPSGPLATPYPQRARSMVYAWDEDSKGAGGLVPGYFGFKFLESPSNSTDGKDNDDDGIVDESPSNDAGFYIDGSTFALSTGIQDTAKYIQIYGPLKPRWSGDENGNWDPLKDDIGIDGIPGTGDFGEGNGKPDIGYDANGNLVSEPNFGIRDVAESDQIGLTSFNALPYTNSTPNVPKNDVFFFQLLSQDSIAIDQTLFDTPSDNVFVYGSGPFTLAPGETQRFSIALLMGQDLPDLILNAETAQRILEANYRFAQPPPKPNVTAVPGDHRVTLYWDDASEHSIDPLTGINDFEGYKIYRSEDPTFSDVFTITDANGSPFLGRPFLQQGQPAQFDLVDEWSGLHPVEYAGRGIKYDLGKNTGLVHQYVDSSATNGKTYYYAVASYDRGFDSLGVQLPPTESQISITKDPITQVYQFDVNTVAVTPGALASGYKNAFIGNGGAVERVKGIATGNIAVQILNSLAVPDGVQYQIDFLQSGPNLVYDLQPLKTYTEGFESRDTIFVPLARKNFIAGSVVVRNASGAVVNASNYELDAVRGRIRASSSGSLTTGATFNIDYQYKAIVQSALFNNEDVNPAFDGMRVFVKNVPLGLDSLNSGWLMVNNSNLTARVQKPLALTAPFTPIPVDFEIQWNATDTTANGKWASPADTFFTSTGRVARAPFKVVNVTDTSTFRVYVAGANVDSLWKPGREIIILNPSGTITTYTAINFSKPATGTTILPAQGNIFSLKTSKPFSTGNQYRFTTSAVQFDQSVAKSQLDNIYVVPNPYVVYSLTESPGALPTQRGTNDLQFRNLPPKCTIRIYTLVGELIETIQKDDMKSYASWSVLSYEGQRLAYGVYIYHVDVPGIGEKIGRFALIK